MSTPNQTNFSLHSNPGVEILPRGLKSRIHGCWLGKSIGGTLGLPAEGKMERLNFSFYDPVPTVAPPNDDLELQLVWLDLVERCDGTLTLAGKGLSRSYALSRELRAHFFGGESEISRHVQTTGLGGFPPRGDRKVLFQIG